MGRRSSRVRTHQPPPLGSGMGCGENGRDETRHGAGNFEGGEFKPEIT
jgi:hypothetical protein